MFTRIATAALAIIGAIIAVELALLVRASARQQAAIISWQYKSYGGAIVPIDAAPDVSDSVLDRVVPLVEIPEMPLDHALDEFTRQTGVRVSIESGSVDAQLQDVVAARLKDRTVRDVMSAILGQVTPTPPFYAGGNVIVVGAEKLETRLYDVRSMIPISGSPDENWEKSRNVGEGLVQLIKDWGMLANWRSRNASAAQLNGILVIHETPRAHQEVSRLLRRLADALARPITAPPITPSTNSAAADNVRFREPETAPAAAGASEIISVRIYDVRSLVGPRMTDSSAGYDLIRLIVENVGPDTWKETGGESGSIEYWNGMLLVRQTAPLHEDVKHLLEKLASGGLTVPPGNGTVPDAPLNQVIDSLDIASSPLSDAMSAFSRQTGIAVTIVGEAKNESQQAPIEVHLRNVTVGDAIETILAQVKPPPTYSVRGNAIVIGSPAELFVKVYDARRLVSMPSFLSPTVSDARADALYRVIIDIDADTWADNGGTGHIRQMGSMLVISQTAMVHHHVVKLLADLERAAASRESK